jgi:hypothetical protein
MASLIAYPLGLLDRVKKTRAHLNPTSLPMDQEYNKLLDEGRHRGDDLVRMNIKLIERKNMVELKNDFSISIFLPKIRFGRIKP